MMFFLTLICGGLYPAVLTGLAQAIFPYQANGSIVLNSSNQQTGSALIGQSFNRPEYFWPRPSATTDFPYNPMASSGSNESPTNPDYLKIVTKRVKILKDAGVAGTIPSEIVQASASGLDPHITPESAILQIPRVAKARDITETRLIKLVKEQTEKPQLGFIGTERINVLLLNLSLNKL